MLFCLVVPRVLPVLAPPRNVVRWKCPHKHRALGSAAERSATPAATSRWCDTVMWSAVIGACCLLLGFLAGSLRSSPADLRPARYAGSRVSESQRTSALVSVTRELAAERKRAQHLEEQIEEDRAARTWCGRRALQVSKSAAWPCGLVSTRLDQSRWMRQWCVEAAANSTTVCEPPEPPDYVILSFLPALHQASARLSEAGGVLSPHHLPWLDEALAFESGGSVVDLGAQFGQISALYALARGATVVAVEEAPRTARALQLTAALNGWESQLSVHVHRLNADEEASEPTGCEGGGSTGAAAGAPTSLPALDDLLSGLPTACAYLRVGVRAVEARLLSGMAATLSSSILQPRFVGLSLRALTCREALETLYGHGYMCSPFGHGPPLRESWAAWDIDRVQRFLHTQGGLWDVRCVSPLVQRHLWQRQGSTPLGALGS